jgi:hypothetical protein
VIQRNTNSAIARIDGGGALRLCARLHARQRARVRDLPSSGRRAAQFQFAHSAYNCLCVQFAQRRRQLSHLARFQRQKRLAVDFVALARLCECRAPQRAKVRYYLIYAPHFDLRCVAHSFLSLSLDRSVPSELQLYRFQETDKKKKKKNN